MNSWFKVLFWSGHLRSSTLSADSSSQKHNPDVWLVGYPFLGASWFIEIATSWIAARGNGGKAWSRELAAARDFRHLLISVTHFPFVPTTSLFHEGTHCDVVLERVEHSVRGSSFPWRLIKHCSGTKKWIALTFFFFIYKYIFLY